MTRKYITYERRVLEAMSEGERIRLEMKLHFKGYKVIPSTVGLVTYRWEGEDTIRWGVKK